MVYRICYSEKLAILEIGICMKEYSYLFERQYKKLDFSTKKNFNCKYWEKILGERKIEYLSKTFSEVYCYLNDSEKYDITIDKNYLELLYIYREKQYELENFDESEINKEIFYTFYIPFIKIARYYVKEKYGTTITQLFGKGFETTLFYLLSKIGFRVLLREFDLVKEEINVEDEGLCYKIFLNNYLTDEKYFNEIIEVYPILLRCLLDKIFNYTKFINYFIMCWENDQELIKNRMKLATIEMSNYEFVGDIHSDSKATIKIKLINGKAIFFKPHSLGLKKMYYDYFNLLCKIEGLEIPQYIMIDRKDYGWEKEIIYKECQSLGEIKRYYQRVGIHIMLCYFMDIQDMHYENLIASAEFPVFIDIEVACSRINKFTMNMNFEEKVKWLYSRSVVGSGILPTNNPESYKFAGITAKKGVILKTKVSRIINPKTKNMKVELQNGIVQVEKNRPKYAGIFYEADSFIKDIDAGFTLAYNHILKYKNVYLNKLFFSHTRILINYTNFYYKLLQLSYHPNFMTDGGKRELVLLQNVEDNADREHLILYKTEVLSMLKGEIPYFELSANSKDIYHNNNVIINDFIHISPYEYILEVSKYLSDTDLKFQRKILYKSLNIPLWKQCKIHISRLQRECKYNRDILIARYTNYVIRLLDEEKITDDTHNNISWINNDAQHQFNITDFYLYNGICGIVIFLAAYNKIYDTNKYMELEKRALSRVFSYTSHLKSSCVKNVGIMCGDASIIYTYLVLYKIKNDYKFIKYAEYHCSIVLEKIYFDNFDLLYGNSGLIIGLTELYSITKKQLYIKKAVYYADFLINYIKKHNKVLLKCKEGVAHGYSGITLAYLRLYKYFKKKEYMDIILWLVQEEDIYLNSELKSYWCHGLGGILMVRKELSQFMMDNCTYEKYIENFKNITFKLDQYCLCHGKIGNFNILRYLEMENHIQKVMYEDKIIASAYELLFNEYHQTEKYNVGFMTGITGIGYILLSILDSNLPDIMRIRI